MRVHRCKTLLLAFFWVVSSAVVADEPAERLRAGKTLVDALAQRRSLNSTGQSLRQLVADLQSNTGIAICLDRRTNPSAIIEVATPYATTKTILEAVASTQSATAVSFADQYAMIGPAQATSRLRTLTELRRQDVQVLRREMNSETYRRLVETRNVSWEQLTEPRQLLIDNAAQAAIEIKNPQMIPHDLWAAAELPTMAFSDLATLVLNQFDLTFEISGEGLLTIVTVPGDVGIEQRHRVAARDQEQVLLRWQAAFPDLDFGFRGSTATVTATVETHERLRELISGNEATALAAAGLKSRLFTLKVQRVPFGALIAELRKQGVPIRIAGKTEAQVKEALQKTAAFDLVKSPSMEFFPQIFEGSGAEVTVTDDEIVLTFPE